MSRTYRISPCARNNKKIHRLSDTVSLKPVRYFFILFPLFALLSCAISDSVATIDEETGDNPNVSFNILSKGSYSNVSLANQFVIRNLKDWQRSWQIHNLDPNQPMPAVNFDNDFVLAVFAGQQPSGGYSVGISKIARKDNNLYVSVTFSEPAANDMVSLALTQPYIFVSTEKVDGKIYFLADK